MVTGSHNPPDYNGLKMVVDGTTLSGADIQDLRARIEAGRLADGCREPTARDDIAPAYVERVADHVRLARPLKIAVDCGNGVAGAFAPALYRRLGCEVTEMFCDVDGHFPNHHPDPSKPENLADLIALLAEGRPRSRLRLRRRRRPPRRRDARRPRHLSRPAADAVRGRRARARAGRDDHLRRQVDAQFEAVDPAPRRRAAALEDRATRSSRAR